MFLSEKKSVLCYIFIRQKNTVATTFFVAFLCCSVQSAVKIFFLPILLSHGVDGIFMDLDFHVLSIP